MSDGHGPHGAGKSSIEFVDFGRVLQALPLTPSTAFLDLGCGRGSYTIPVAEAIGPRGKVYAVDAWQAGLDDLSGRAASAGIDNIETVRANVGEGIPLEGGVVDICFMATVLHDFVREGSAKVAMKEITRLLKPGGKLFVIEFKKVEDGPGPPVGVRLAPGETEDVIGPYGFVTDLVTDVGQFVYLLAASLK